MKKHFAKLLLVGAMSLAGFAFVGCNDIEKEISDLKGQVENLESTTAANLQAAIDALNAKLASDYALKTDVSALEAALNGTIAEKVAAVEAKLNKTIEDAIAAAKAENADAIAKVSADLAAVSEELAAVASEVKDATSKIDENTAAIAGVDAKALELKATIDSLAEYLDVLEAQVKENNSTLVSLSDYLAVLEAQVKENNSTLVSLSEYMETIEAMIKENNSTLVSLSEFFEVFENEVDMKFTEIHGSLAALSTYLEELEASIDARFAEHQNTFLSLSIFLEEHEISVDARFAEVLATFESLSQHLDAEEAEVEAKLNELRNTLESLSPVIAQMQAQILENNSTLQSLSKYLEEQNYQGQINELKDQIEAHYAMLQELHTTVYFSLADHLDTLEAQLAALAQKDVDVQAVLDAYKAEIEAIKVTLGLVGEQVAIIANQIQSIVYVPEYESGMQADKLSIPTSATKTADFVLVQGTFEVSPKHLATKVEGNAFFSAVYTKGWTKAAVDAEYFEAKVIDADATTGRVVAYAYVPATEVATGKTDVYHKLINDGNVQFSFGVADAELVQQIGTTDIIDLGSYVSSTYVDVASWLIGNKDINDVLKFKKGNKTYSAITIDENTHKVAFNTAVANSSRNLFEGYSYCVVLNDEVYTLAEAAELFNVPALTVTYGEDVDPVWSSDDAEELIPVTGKNLTATAKLAEAASKDNVGDYVEVSAATISVNGVETALTAAARYQIVNKTATTGVVVKAVKKDWAYDSFFALDRNGVSYHKGFEVAELEVSGVSDIADIANSITLTAEVDDVTYNASIERVASKIVSASVPALPFGGTYVFEAEVEVDNVNYPVSFEVTIAAEPEDAKIELGKLSAVVSNNHETIINSNFVGKALAEHPSFYTGVKFGQVYNKFNGTVTVTKDGVDYSNFVEFVAAPKTNDAGQAVGADNKVTDDVKKYIEASTITINSGLAKGTYDVEYVVNAFGVKYTYVAKLEVVEPVYSLSTVPQFVKNGVVTVSGVTTMPKVTVDKEGNVTSSSYARFESHSINLKDYFQVEGVAKGFHNDVKVVYTIKDYATEDTYIAPIWMPNYQSDYNYKNYKPAYLAYEYSNVMDNGKVLSDNHVYWRGSQAPPTYYYGNDNYAYAESAGYLSEVVVTAYLVKNTETATTDEALAKVAYDKETITIVQKDRISSFTQKANSGVVTYKNGANNVNIMSFIETMDFNGNVLSNPYAEALADYWDTPTGFKTNAIECGVRSLYHTTIVFGEPSCDLLTAGVVINPNTGTLTFTNNSADLLSDVVVTIPVYLTYDYDNAGSTAKKVEVKVTFKPGVADDTTPEGGNTTPEGEGNDDSNGADDLLDNDMGI